MGLRPGSGANHTIKPDRARFFRLAQTHAVTRLNPLRLTRQTQVGFLPIEPSPTPMICKALARRISPGLDQRDVTPIHLGQ